ncbi:MAG: DNA cytosine methyltransferase [archaeon]|nr:DNA cytosine methyltransferase [archaeon]MCR4323406.1 DNA cytosine methyltransferase [Nanoarchaeota archaeon]
MEKEWKAISLFAGCGGDTQGLEDAGIKVVGFVEFWKRAIETHKLNFPESTFIGQDVGGDITKISDEEFRKYEGQIDVLFAGFPCQGFSHAGKKDPNDTRNKLFWEFVRATKLIKPKWIIGENVAGLLHRKTDDGESDVAEVIVKAFEEIGYKMAKPKVLKAEEYGVPQKRRRVFFVGSKEGIEFGFPKPLHTKNNLPTIRHLIELTNINSVESNPSEVHELKEKDILFYDSDEEPTGKPHPYLLMKLKEGKISFGRRISPHHIEMANLDSPTKTIHCGYSFQPRLYVGIKNNKGFFLRDFTNKELAQIQGFPKEYMFAGNRADVVKQIGNAVPPKLVEEIAREIMKRDKKLSG